MLLRYFTNTFASEYLARRFFLVVHFYLKVYKYMVLALEESYYFL